MIKEIFNILIYIFFPSLFTLFFTSDINSKNYMFFMLISHILLTIYFIFKYKKEFKYYTKTINKKNLLITIIYWIIGFILMMILNYIINYIIIPNGISTNEALNRELLLNNKFIYSILLCLFIPILEEIVFRLELKKNLKNKYLFIFISSLIFAIPHILSSTNLIELIYIFPYFILGLTFTTIYQKTNNILYNILAHILHNTLIVLIILLF